MVAVVAGKAAGIHRLAALVAVLAVMAGTQAVRAPSASAAGFSASTTTTTTTTTTLSSFPRSAFQDIPTVLLVNVAPRDAAGSIQVILDESTALSTPIPITTGFALLITPLPKGTHSLTAVFIPTDPAAFTPSISSPVSLTVNSIP